MIRFVPWSEVGTITVSPGDNVVEVGAFELAEGADTLWVRMTNTGTQGPWPWSYGILSFKTDEGQPLGSIKAYNSFDGEVFRLGVGLPPSVRAGVLTFEPRGFNMAWIKQGNPWTLKFEAQSGTSSGQVNDFWNRDPVNGSLSPATEGDDVLLGSGFLAANSADINNGEIKLESNGYLTADRGSFYSGEPPSTSNSFSGVYLNYPNAGRSGWIAVYKGGIRVFDNNGVTNTPNVLIDATGTANFVGNVTAPNITLRSSDERFYSLNASTGESEYTGPELNLLLEIQRLEALVKELYERLRMNPESGWPVWDGNEDLINSNIAKARHI